MAEEKEVKDKHIYGSEEKRDEMIKSIKKAYQKKKMSFKDYMLQLKLIEKYWVVTEEPKPDAVADVAKIEPTSAGTPNLTFTDIVTGDKPLDLTGAFGK